MKESAPALRRPSLLKITALFLAAPVAPALLTAWLHPRSPDWSALRAEALVPAPERLGLAEIRSRWPQALWVDARAADAFEKAHVPGAVLLNEDDWEKGFSAVVDAWEEKRGIVVYCGGENCRASEAVARRLRHELGSERVFVLAGGWDAWRAGEGRGP